MKKISFLVAGMLVFCAIPHQTRAYSTLGVRWPATYPNVTVAVDYSTIPTQWNSTITGALMAWNNAGSKLRFSAIASGSHTVSLKFAWFASWLALTRLSSTGSTISDVNVVFNNRFSWDVNGAANKYDAGQTLTHELGHWTGLADLYEYPDRYKTMYGYSAVGEMQQRTLEQDDIIGVRAIYGVR